VHETPEDLERLQSLLDATRDRAGEHLRGIFEGPGPFRRVEAEELAKRLTGMRLLAVATVSSRGEPRVAPVDGHFYRGRFFFSSPSNAFRIRHLKANPAISAIHFEGESLFVQVHGRAELLAPGDDGFDELDAQWKRHYGNSVTGFGPGIFIVRIEPDRMLAYGTK
jgi:hypothetical protein